MPIHFEARGSVALVTLDRPEVANAVDRPTATELADAFRRFDGDDALHVAVLTGANGTFCAGADLKAMREPAPRGPRVAPDGDGPMGPTRMLLGKPVIAAVEGHAVAGGLELAAWCDLRVAAEDAVFGVYCRRWGVPLIDGGTIRLARLIGHSHALDLILTGRGVSGDEALRMGLANRLVPPGTRARGGPRPGAGDRFAAPGRAPHATGSPPTSSGPWRSRRRSRGSTSTACRPFAPASCARGSSATRRGAGGAATSRDTRKGRGVKPERILVVGGGIGGMAFAAALQRLGLPFLLLEQAEALGEVGSGLGVLPGAVRALEALGVGAELYASGAPFRRFRVASRRGEDLAELSFTRVFERAGRAGYVMPRAALHAALAARVAPEALRTGARAVAVSQQAGEVQVALEGGGAPIRGDLLVGADGLGSVVRSHVLGDGAPRYAGESFFRGIAELRLEEPELSREIFGDGRRTAYYDLGAGRVYWWASAPLPAGSVVPRGERRAYLRRAFEGWPFGVTELYARTPEESILQNDGFDRPPARRWHRGAAVLLGDAAHPTTPNLGQGACMAIEDAVVLARAIQRAETPAEAFRAFSEERRRRTARTVRLSRLWGAAGLWRGPLLAGLRDAAFRRVPGAWLEAAAREQYCYDPGTLAAPSQP